MLCVLGPALALALAWVLGADLDCSKAAEKVKMVALIDVISMIDWPLLLPVSVLLVRCSHVSKSEP